MTLPASGAISFNNINVELGVSGTTQASLGQTSYRTLAGVASGQISMSNFYGKANQFAFTVSSNQTNANLRTLAVNAGWNQSTKVVATINSGVNISSNGTGTPALTVNGSFPGGVQLVNNGIIVGMGGAGGNGGSTGAFNPSVAALSGFNGSSAGVALSTSVAITVTNNGTIAGGGGGGGGGGGNYNYLGKGYNYGAGGGGGGGRSSFAANSSGGARPATIWVGGATAGSGTLSSAGGGHLVALGRVMGRLVRAHLAARGAHLAAQGLPQIMELHGVTAAVGALVAAQSPETATSLGWLLALDLAQSLKGKT